MELINSCCYSTSNGTVVGQYDYLKLKESTAVFGIARQFSRQDLLDQVGGTSES